MTETSNGGSAQAGRRAEWALATAVLLCAGWFYFWTATSGANPFSSVLQHDDLYNRLSDGFLAGKLSFLEKPDPRLASLDDPWDPALNAGLSPYHDVSYFEGKYYLYFGPAPAVLLLAPWKAITGTYLGENVAAAVFALLGAGASIATAATIRRRHFPRTRKWTFALCYGGVAFGNFCPLLLRRPLYYELAISSAYAFSALTLLSVAQGLEEGPRRGRWLALSGLFFGLTLLSRPNFLFGGIVLGVPFLLYWRAWRAGLPFDTLRLRKDLLAVGIPLGLMLALLLCYNIARFGNPAEFGQYFQLSGINPHKDVHTTFGYLPTNLWFYFPATSELGWYFPFFRVIHMPWFHFPIGYTGEEDVYGIINAPFYWAAALLFWASRDARIPHLRGLMDFSIGTGLLSLLNLLVIGRIGGAANRYMVDLFPNLLPLACAGIFWIEASILAGLSRFTYRAVWIAAIVVTVAFNVLVSLEHNDLLQYYKPALYRKIAHTFDHISLWAGVTKPEKVGPLRIRLRFPADQVGKVEPILVTGISFKADFIYVYYASKNHLQIGFEHTSYGGPKTPAPIEVDFSKEHVLEISMGSLYPPKDHPYYDTFSATSVRQLKNTLTVNLDGSPILAGTCDFYESSPGDVSVGSNPVSDAFGKRFSGKILEVSRMPVPLQH